MFDHNLGLGTRKSSLTPSDREPATFWITSPLTTLTNNAAAGSVSKSGVGIWYLFPDEPVGPSAGLGLFAKREAKNTPIGRCGTSAALTHATSSPLIRFSSRFFNNAAHSNGNTGLAVNRRLGDGHTIIGCSTYTPLVDPKSKRSEYQPIYFDTFHGKEIKATGCGNGVTLLMRALQRSPIYITS